MRGILKHFFKVPVGKHKSAIPFLCGILMYDGYCELVYPAHLGGDAHRVAHLYPHLICKLSRYCDAAVLHIEWSCVLIIHQIHLHRLCRQIVAVVRTAEGLRILRIKVDISAVYMYRLLPSDLRIGRKCLYAVYEPLRSTLRLIAEGSEYPEHIRGIRPLLGCPYPSCIAQQQKCADCRKCGYYDHEYQQYDIQSLAVLQILFYHPEKHFFSPWIPTDLIFLSLSVISSVYTYIILSEFLKSI